MSKLSRIKNRRRKQRDMKKQNEKATAEIKKINFRDNTVLDNSITAESIPTLAPEDKIKLFSEGDIDPYYKVQEIEYPIVANGYNYTESFFESFVSKINRAPIPGSKSGHSMDWGARPPVDLLLIGGKLSKNGDGTGKVYFKNYIPKKLDTDNESFIKQAKADMIHFSLVAYTRDEIITLNDGSRQINVVESLYGERNDAVEYNAGAMEQKTNHEKPEEPESKKNTGVIMNELLEKLATFKANGELKNEIIAEKLGLELRTDADKVNAAEIERYKSVIGSVEDAEKIAGSVKENAQAGMKAKVSELFGTEKVNGKDNRAHQYAMKICSKAIDSADREAFDAEIESLKSDPIAIELKANLAKPFSKENMIGEVEGDGESENKIETFG